MKTLEYIGLLVFWEAIDMITDWVLYTDVKSIEPGLVYGPPDDGIIRALLAFSVIGTLTFVAQVAFLLLDYFMKVWLREKDSMQNFVYESDLISLLTIVLEDFPQIVITLTLVTCREEGISYVQIVKAILPIIEILARITCLLNLLKPWKKFGKMWCDELRCSKGNLITTVAWMRVLGLVVVFILNVTMLILTTTENEVDSYGNSTSTLKGKHFKHIFDEEYNDERYIKTVGIYLHYPLFDYEKSSSKSLLHLIEISDLENANVAEFRIFNDAETRSKFIIQKSTGRYPFYKLSECFQLLNNKIKRTSPCENTLMKFSTFALRFEFKERNIPSLILGDIDYNWKTDITGHCSQKIDKDAVIPSVHYYRSKPGVNTTHHLNLAKNGTRFFNTDDLIDVKYLWKTSFSSCQSKGRTSPHLDKHITLICAS